MSYFAMPVLNLTGSLFPPFRDMFGAGLDENKRYNVVVLVVGLALWFHESAPARFWENDARRCQPRLESIEELLAVTVDEKGGESWPKPQLPRLKSGRNT
jgi:hypothetical protein